MMGSAPGIGTSSSVRPSVGTFFMKSGVSALIIRALIGPNTILGITRKAFRSSGSIDVIATPVRVT